jgi:Tfp pilus assembly protein PilF
MSGRGVGCAAILAGALAAGLAAAAPAQEPSRRLKLSADADTNDPNAYYQHGLAIIRDKPRMAAQAFYWAHRLAPDWPDPLYGQSLALLLDQRGLLPKYLEGGRGAAKSKDLRASDSLFRAALALNPFVYRRFDRMLFDAYIEIVGRRYRSVAGQPPDNGGLRFAFEREILGSPFLAGWMAFAQGHFVEATQAYTAALERAPSKAEVLVSRARAEFLMLAYPAALSDLTEALAELRRTEEEDLAPFYDSKALLEYSVGVVHQRMGNQTEAREAFARALQEDLSYYQAHVQMGAMALAGGDTAAAVSEYELATQIQSQDPVVQYRLGALFLGLHQHEAAATHFKTAIAAEPLYAPPYASLGGIYDRWGQPSDALGQYLALLARQQAVP